MGEDPCLEVQHLSHSPRNSNDEEAKGSTMSAALGGSVSFGRFLSESLDWGKWSSFCQKRHLEDVEKYSIPGSVAQKKAFFEAHYKRAAAARKSASAVLEQANAATHDADLITQRGNRVEGEDECIPSSSDCIEDALDSANDKISNKPSSRIDSPEIADDVENQLKVNDHMEPRISLSERRPLKESSLINRANRDSISIEKKPRVPTPKQAVIRRSSRLTSSPLPKSFSPEKLQSSSSCERDKKTTPNSKKSGIKSNENDKSILGSLHASVNFSQRVKGAIAPKSYKTSAKIEKVGELNDVRSPKAFQDRFNHLKTTARASLNGVAKCDSVTTQSKHGRERMLPDQRLTGRAKVDAKPYRDSVDYSKSLGIRGNRPQAQNASSSISFRTSERVEKRKEFSHNLEDKLCGKEAKKQQLQEASKKKAANDIKKTCQSLSFKARPLPAFYHRTDPPKVAIKKVPPTVPQPPKLSQVATTGPQPRKLGRNSKPGSNPHSLRPTQTSINDNRSMHPKGKSGRTSRSATIMKPTNAEHRLTKIVRKHLYHKQSSLHG